MTQEEILALQNKVKELEVEAQTAKDNEAKALADKNTTVQELTTLRTAKQEVEAKLTLAESKLNPSNPSQGNVEDEVNKVLAAKEDKRLADMRVTLEQKFKESHSEFRPENDEGGLKYAAFKQKLARINLTGLTTEEEITSAYDDAFVLMNKPASSEQPQFNPYAATTKTQSGNPTGVNNNKLTNPELKLIAQLGWTEERYLKVKKAQPHYVESMISQVK